MKILVTGGAGYIGSHTIKNLLKEGFSVVILDNLSTGFIQPIEILKKKFNRLEFVKADLKSKEQLDEIFLKRKIEAVIHFAAKVSVSESVKKPELYYQENFINSVNLLEAMTKAGVNKFIFSSSCVVYGTPEYVPVDENHPTYPESPYGQTKLDFEQYLAKVQNLKYVIFRYFNVGGSDPEGLLGKANFKREDLIANIIKVALGQSSKLCIFGDDYETPDGTAIRDFLHVEDIAKAHILALNKVDQIARETFNLGSENGFSVKEIVQKAREVIKKEIPTEIQERRPGDIPISVASAKKVKAVLGWQPLYSRLDTIIKTDWVWRKKNPFGYRV
ncbi:MAG: UDP-glucose 4-epimerase GalE [Patescibacteria group bacterium]|jgi:UDP-glucose 4-epimerase